MPSYNLLQEGWIPCVTLDGNALKELSLKEALLQAREIREVSDPSPLVTLALHRLMLAVLHRIFGPEDAAAWGDLWENGWDPDRISEYFERENVRDRFDLFSPDRPFYQCKSLDFKSQKSIAHLAHQIASGANPKTLFDHTLECQMTPAEAARSLVAFQSYAVGGLLSWDLAEHKSADAAPLVRGAAVLVRGQTLFHTLMLNLHQYSAAQEQPFPIKGEDLPAWEKEGETQAGDRWPQGYLDLLTWQSRRVRLAPPGDNGQIEQVVIMKGWQFPDGYHSRHCETMLAYRKALKPAKGQDPWPVVGFREDRAIWRDSLALLESAQPDSQMPRSLKWLGELVHDEGILPSKLALPLELLGLCTDQARVVLWRHEHMLLPLAYLRQPSQEQAGLIGKLREGIKLAEAGHSALRHSTTTLARLILAPDADQPGGHQPKSELVTSLAQSILPGRLYWGQLEVPFRQLLASLPEDITLGPGETAEYGLRALPEWGRQVRRAALEAFESASGSLGLSNASIKAVAKAEMQLLGELNGALAPVLGDLQDVPIGSSAE